MKLYFCKRKDDQRDTWYELVLNTGNKIGIVHKGQGQYEFWGGYLPEDADSQLLYDTDVPLDGLYSDVKSLFASVTGETEYEQNFVTPLHHNMLRLMGTVGNIEKHAPALWPHELKGYFHKFSQQIDDAQANADKIKVINTATGIDGTFHTGE